MSGTKISQESVVDLLPEEKVVVVQLANGEKVTLDNGEAVFDAPAERIVKAVKANAAASGKRARAIGVFDSEKTDDETKDGKKIVTRTIKMKTDGVTKGG